VNSEVFKWQAERFVRVLAYQPSYNSNSVGKIDKNRLDIPIVLSPPLKRLHFDGRDQKARR
jgi:hypothetical protein